MVGNSSGLFSQRVIVGVGDMAVSNGANVTISTYALGSCVGVVAYDVNSNTGGMLHVMLPDSTISPQKAQNQPFIFADTGITKFLSSLKSFDIDEDSLKVVIAGGANIMNENDAFRIGDKNVDSVKKQLQLNNLKLIDESLGGLSNRTLHFSMKNAVLSIKTPDKQLEVSLV